MSTHTTSQSCNGETRSAGSPIDVLSRDLLWRIFLLNANMEDDFKPTHWDSDWGVKQKYNPAFRALTVARRTSQVCRYWRELMLGWPSVWSRLIDLDDLLMHRRELWSKEVLRRTAQSPLYITGTVHLFNMTSKAFFLSLLQDWERVKIIDVKVEDHSSSNPVDVSRILTSASRYLESLKVKHQPAFWIGKGATTVAPLCLTNFPSLRELSVDCYFLNFNLDRHPQFFSNICVLTLNDSCKAAQITTFKMVEFLRHTPFLESLTLYYAISPYNSVDKHAPILKTVHLTRLTEISVHDDTELALALLDRINPQAGCSLHLDIVDQQSARSAAHRVLSRYSRSYFNSRSPTWLSLQMMRNDFKIAEFAPWNISWRRFLVTVHAANANDTISPFLFTTISPCRFTHVTHLEFKIARDLLQNNDPELIDFLLSFVSLEVMVTTVDSLIFLLQMPRNIPIIFPSLKTLRMVNMIRHTDSDTPVLHFFLDWRRWQAVPVHSLDFRMIRWIQSLLSIPHLGEMPNGLKVIWNDPGDQVVEHVCGNNQYGASISY